MQNVLDIEDKPDKWKCGITDCRLKSRSIYGASGVAGSGTGAAAASSPTAAAAAGSGGGSAGPSLSKTVPKATALTNKPQEDVERPQHPTKLGEKQNFFLVSDPGGGGRGGGG